MLATEGKLVCAECRDVLHTRVRAMIKTWSLLDVRLKPPRLSSLLISIYHSEKYLKVLILTNTEGSAILVYVIY